MANTIKLKKQGEAIECRTLDGKKIATIFGNGLIKWSRLKQMFSQVNEVKAVRDNFELFHNSIS